MSLRTCLPLLAVALLPLTACNNAEVALDVVGIEEAGPIERPENVRATLSATGGIVDGRYLWAFNETWLKTPAADGATRRSSTAATAPVHAPRRTTQPLDAAGAPLPLIRKTRQERRFSEQPDTPRVVLEPTAVVNAATGRDYVIFLKAHLHADAEADGDFEAQQVGIARIEPGPPLARRLPEPLFEMPDPLVRNALADGDFVYLYGSFSDGRSPRHTAVARAPRGRVHESDAYRYWNGEGWSDDPAAAVDVLFDVPGEMSVSYNHHLRRYLAVYTPPLENAIVLRTAEAPWGPFSEPTRLDLDPPPAAEQASGPGRDLDDRVSLRRHRGAREQPALTSADGRRVAVVFYRPLGPGRGEIILAYIELN